MPADNKKYPNIIFLDGVPSKRLGGISQTLYNLFDTYPKANLFAMVDQYQLDEIDENSLSCTLINIRIETFGHIKTRFISRLNPLVKKVNSFLRELVGIKLETASLPDNAYLLVCTTNPHKLHAAKLIHERYKYPLITYYMDDWMAEVKLNWILGNLDQLVKYTLDKATKRLMISEPLNEILTQRYSPLPKPTYVVHNPVDIKEAFVKPSNISEKLTIKIIYAGSIWAMHLDALLLIVNVINKVNQLSSKKYELCIYSKKFFWDNNLALLDKPGVSYGGFIEYNDLEEKLSKADFLLVTSSFLKEFKSFSQSSVQTKLTDYMKVGLPVLSVGPVYGACNNFVKKWQCGYVWDNTDQDGLANYLNKIALDDHQYQTYAKNAYDVVKNNFTKPIVQQQLYSFIAETVN